MPGTWPEVDNAGSSALKQGWELQLKSWSQLARRATCRVLFLWRGCTSMNSRFVAWEYYTPRPNLAARGMGCGPVTRLQLVHQLHHFLDESNLTVLVNASITSSLHYYKHILCAGCPWRPASFRFVEHYNQLAQAAETGSFLCCVVCAGYWYVESNWKYWF